MEIESMAHGQSLVDHQEDKCGYTSVDRKVDSGAPALPPAPDGGCWAWIVVGASFCIHGMIDGLFSVFGVFLQQFLDYYGSSRAKTAVIGSLISAFLLLTGPVASVLVSVFSCRKVVMLGALLISGGLLLSTLAPTVEVLIVTFGVIAGIGLGLICLPGVVIVGFWFEKKRALAMGLASSGAGLGMLVLAPVSGVLLEHYDWKNALMLVSGVMLQGVVCGALLRPVEFTKPKSKQTNGYHGFDSSISSPETGLKVFQQNQRFRTTSVNIHDRVCPKAETKKYPFYERVADTGQEYVDNKTVTNHSDKVFFSSFQQMTADGYSRTSNPLMRKDLFYSGSIQDIDKRHRSASLIRQATHEHHTKDKSDYQNCTKIKDETGCCQNKDYLQVAMSMLSVHILKDPAFIIICLANSAVQGGFVLCIYFATDYGISLGIDGETASYLISAYGIGTSVGRLTAGLMVAIPWFEPEYVTSVSLILGGLFAVASGAFCSNFISLAVCIGMTGLLVAPICPLTSVMSVDYLGLEYLTNAHGMVAMGKGITSLATAPLAGFLQDVTGSYSPPFYLAGAFFVLGGLLHFLLPLVNRKRNLLPKADCGKI